MTDPTSTPRVRVYRARQAGTLAYPRCDLCGRLHRGKYAPLCQPCWERNTPEGKAAVALRQQRHRDRKRAKVTDCEQAQGECAG
jgi:hypothetical protein